MDGGDEQAGRHDAQQPPPRTRLLEVDVLAAELGRRLAHGGLADGPAHRACEVIAHGAVSARVAVVGGGVGTALVA